MNKIKYLSLNKNLFKYDKIVFFIIDSNILNNIKWISKSQFLNLNCQKKLVNHIHGLIYLSLNLDLFEEIQIEIVKSKNVTAIKNLCKNPYISEKAQDLIISQKYNLDSDKEDILFSLKKNDNIEEHITNYINNYNFVFYKNANEYWEIPKYYLND